MKKEQEQIDYADVIALGFKRESGSDNVWFNQFGYEYFIVSRKIIKNAVYADWDVEKRTVDLIRTNKDHDVKSRLPVYSLEELKAWINFFEGKKVKEEEEFNYSHIA